MIHIPEPSTLRKKAAPTIFLGLASHDHRVHNRFMMSLLSLVTCGKFHVQLSNVSSGGIHKARNNLAFDFLTKSKCDYFLSVDSDISFTPEQVERLISHDRDVVGGLYCHKKLEVQWTARPIPNVGPDPKTSLQEMSAIGTGFILVKRHVFEKIRDQIADTAHVEDWIEDNGETKWDFFAEGVVTEPIHYPKPTFLSEDFYFCKRCRDAGFKVYLDLSFNLTHWDGGTGYPNKNSIMPSPPAQPAEAKAEPVKEEVAA